MGPNVLLDPTTMPPDAMATAIYVLQVNTYPPWEAQILNAYSVHSESSLAMDLPRAPRALLALQTKTQIQQLHVLLVRWARRRPGAIECELCPAGMSDVDLDPAT